MWRHILALCLSLFLGTLAAAETNPVRRHPDVAQLPVHRVIIKWKDDGRARALSATAPTVAALGVQRAQALTARTGVALSYERSLPARMQVLRFDHALRGAELDRALSKLRADGAVAFVQPDRRKFALAVPNDPLFGGQWYLQKDQVSAINAVDAWDLSQSSRGTVVAVLDTGVRFEHPDLMRASQAGKLLPGYDFVSLDSGAIAATANDGDGRDADPSDPGDWVSDQDAQTPEFSGCAVGDSSWHGTRVAGIAGALTNNSAGIAGTGWSDWILPVRVLGKCGGYDSDIIAAMGWSAGLATDGVPTNPYPAKVLNLSLGSATSCSAAYQNIVDELATVGVLVVASAGNETGPVDEPANCAGVLAVGGLRHVGTKVGYSSLGPEVGISAPAGNCVNETGACLFPINSTSNSGTTIPAASTYTDQVTQPTIGTSFSSPLAAGVAALMHGANGQLSAAGLINRIQEGSLPFPPPDPSLPMCTPDISSGPPYFGQCNCTTTTCGAGMLNALGAVQQALRPIAEVVAPGAYAAGQTITLDGANSSAACGHNIVSYLWEVTSGAGAINGSPATATASVTAPGTGSFTVRLTVTDEQGRQDTDSVTINPTAPSYAEASELSAAHACPAAISVAQEPPPPPPGGGGGGGGSVDLGALLLLGAGVFALRRTRRATPGQ